MDMTTLREALHNFILASMSCLFGNLGYDFVAGTQPPALLAYCYTSRTMASFSAAALLGSQLVWGSDLKPSLPAWVSCPVSCCLFFLLKDFTACARFIMQR